MKLSPASQVVFKMSTTKRLAKRSIVGTRVCAPGPNKLYYSGIITKVKTPPSFGGIHDTNCIMLTADTKYIVRFDFGQSMVGSSEYLGSELIGPGFQSVMNVNLAPGQRTFITYNGRESSAEVLSYDCTKDEVCVRIPGSGSEVNTILLLFYLGFTNRQTAIHKPNITKPNFTPQWSDWRKFPLSKSIHSPKIPIEIVSPPSYFRQANKQRILFFEHIHAFGFFISFL